LLARLVFSEFRFPFLFKVIVVSVEKNGYTAVDGD
jgi:hypothetical protein